MSENSIGNTLYRLTFWARAALFDQGELAQLTYISYETTISQINSMEEEIIRLTSPIGYGPDRKAIL
jgi:hypothetical protein